TAFFGAFLLLAGVRHGAANLLVQGLLFFVPEARDGFALQRLIGVGARFALGVGELEQLFDGGRVGVAQFLGGRLELGQCRLHFGFVGRKAGAQCIQRVRVLLGVAGLLAGWRGERRWLLGAGERGQEAKAGTQNERGTTHGGVVPSMPPARQLIPLCSKKSSLYSAPALGF